MTVGGGENGSEEKGREGQEARREEEDGEEAREEVVLPVVASPDVGKDVIALVGAGAPNISIPTIAGQHFTLKPGKYKTKAVHLPPGVLEEDVEVSEEYDPTDDENMKLVREVNEDPRPVLKVSVNRKMAVPLESIVISLKLEEE